MKDKLTKRLEAMEKRARDRRRADARYVQEHYPGLADFLTEFARFFGKDGFKYRAVLRRVNVRIGERA